MVDKKISELPEAATLTGLEELPAVQGPDTVRVSIQEIANLASGAPSALIYETVLNAPAESVTISVPAGHGDLELVVVGRATASADTDLRMTFNGDTGNNYDSIRENRFGATTYTDTSYISFAQIAGANSPSNVITSIHARIFAYDSSQFHKSVIIQASTKFPSYTGLQSVTGHWESVSPITSIAIEAPGTTFVTGTIFRLYGKKAVSYVPTTIAALSDVDFVPAPTNSQVLTYNSTTSKWEPKDTRSPLWVTTPIPPTISGKTLLVSSGASVNHADTTRGFVLSVTGSGTAADRTGFLYQGQPDDTWTYTVLFSTSVLNTNYKGFGIATRNSADGSMTSFVVGAGAGFAAAVQNWNSIDSFASAVNVNGDSPTGPMWIRVQRAATVYTMSFSYDGEYYYRIWTGTPTFSASDQVGIWLCVNDQGSTGAFGSGTAHAHIMSETLAND